MSGCTEPLSVWHSTRHEAQAGPRDDRPLAALAVVTPVEGGGMSDGPETSPQGPGEESGFRSNC